MTAGVQAERNQNDHPNNRILWILFFIFALLVHLLLFRVHLDWSPSTATPRVEIQEVNPKKLESIRRQWREKNLLLDKNPSRPKDQTAPPKDARTLSDRNIRVEKEQRARETQILPKSGRMGGSDSSQTRRQKQEQSKPSAREKLSDLSKLALPFQLSAHPPGDQTERAPLIPRGGDQAIDDPSLPEGSENLLNAQESVYYSFYARLYEAVGPLWQNRTSEAMQHNAIGPGEYVTVVDIVLDQNGNLKEIRRLQSCGVEVFDNAVDETWRKIREFPNPPQGLLDQEKQVHTRWRFKVRVGQGFGMTYLPPQRSGFSP